MARRRARRLTWPAPWSTSWARPAPARTPYSTAPARCCRPTCPIAFAHRYITRPADTGGENHVALSAAEFALRRAHGLFAFHWHAHGNDYGIGHEIHAWRHAGLAVVVSGSREHFRTMDGIDEATVPVLITAPAERLKERLLKRGREDAAAAAERLQRGLSRRSRRGRRGDDHE